METSLSRRRARAAAPLTERRFPLDLHPRISSIRDLYEQAKRLKWDPARSLDWNTFDASRYSEAARDVARRAWSARAWTEFGRIAETPALLIRFCLEHDGESDAKMYLATRGTQEVVWMESCTRLAGLLGGFIPAPEAIEGELVQIEDHRYRDALDGGVLPVAYIAAHGAIRDGLVTEILRETLRSAEDPFVLSLTRRLVQDKESQASFGWLYLQETVSRWSADTRGEIVAEIVDVLKQPGLHAYMGGWAPHVDDDDNRAVLRALGVPDQATVITTIRRFVGDARKRFETLGIQLPRIDHPRLGAL